MTTNQKLDQILEKVNLLDTKVDTLDTKVTFLDEKVDSLDKRTANLEADMKDVKQKTTVLEADMKDVKQKTTVLEADIKDVKQTVTYTNLIIENELRVNIKRVAEGHLDLSRRLDEYIKLSHEIKDKQELQDIYINMHSSKLAKLC